MKETLLLALLAGLIAGCASQPVADMDPAQRLDYAQAVTTNWYTYSEVVAMKLMSDYGPPDEVETDRLVWKNKGPWQDIAVWNVEDYYYSSVAGPDNLEEAVAYAVPADKRKALTAFSDKVRVSRDGRTLSARSNSEPVNFLTLNLADEIARGARDPADARSFYTRTYQLSEAGKSSPYMQGLLFRGPPGPPPQP